MKAFLLACGAVFLLSLLPATANAAGPSFEYKVAKTGRINLTGMNLGKTRELGFQEVAIIANDNARNGWRMMSADIVQEDAHGGYSFVMVFERQIGVTYVEAPKAPEPTPTPRPERTPLPPPAPVSNDPCAAATPCVVETFLGSELTVEIGRKYNVKLKSGDIVNGTVTAARRLEVVLDMGAKGSRTLTNADISDMTLR
jgi:hypothetical protein